MFFGDKKLLALDLGTSSLKLAELELGRSGPVLKKFAIAPIEPGMVSGGEIVDVGSVGQVLDAALKSIKTKRKNIATAMWGTSVIVKKISMPKMDANLISEQIKWEAEQYIPFDINEISLDYHILRGAKENTESMDVLIVAAKQEFLFRFVETIESANLRCSVIDVSGFALANCFEANYGKVNGAVALLNIGSGVTNFVVVDSGDVIFSRDISVGGSIFTSDINKALGVSLSEAESLKISASYGQEVPDEVNGVIAATNEQVVDEIRGSFDFYNATSNGTPISRTFVSGGAIYTPGLMDLLSKGLGVPYEVLDPFQKISYDKKAFSEDYIAQIKSLSPVVLGLGLRKMEGG